MTIMEQIFINQAKNLTKDAAYFAYGRNLVDRVLKTHPDVKLKQNNEEVEDNSTANKQEEKPVEHEKKEYTTTYSVETENSTDNKEDNITANEQKGNAEQEQEEKLNLALEKIIIEHAKDLTKDEAYIAYGKDLVDNVLKTHPDVKFKQSDEETEAFTDKAEAKSIVNEENKGKPVEQEQEEKSVKHEKKEPFKMQDEKPANAAYSEKAKASTDKAEAKSIVNEENKGKPVSKKQEKKRNKMREWANRITGRKERETASKVEEIYDPNNDKILLNIDAAKKAGNMSVLYTSLYELADIAKQLINKLRDRFDKNVAKQLDCYIRVLNYFQIKVEY